MVESMASLLIDNLRWVLL